VTQKTVTNGLKNPSTNGRETLYLLITYLMLRLMVQ